MQDTWATSGLDLHMDLAGPRVKRAVLEEALRVAVRSGRFPAGTRLPSSRALAGDLGVARNTVADAYAQLVAEGWLVARRGSGTQVADRPGSNQEAPRLARQEPTRHRYDLRAGSPDLSSFPRAAWSAAARATLRDAPDGLLGYGDPQGTLELRQALASYLARARGVRADPSRIVICSGFTQGLGLICQALRGGGATTVAVEAFGLPASRDTITAAGLRAATVPVDDDGADLSGAGDADAVVLTPAHQFPLGVVLAPQRRTAALRWAEQTGGVVIEDDYDGEFRYYDRPVGAIQGLAPDRVVYAGTTSKTLAPGLRLSWLVVPPSLLHPVVAAKVIVDRQTETLGQLTLARFIASGHYDRHIRRRRHAYRRRRDTLGAALRDQGLPVQVTGVSAGLHALVNLPGSVNEDDVIADARQRGLALEGLTSYILDHQPHRPALVVGYAAPPDHAYTTAIERLRTTLDHCTNPAPRR